VGSPIMASGLLSFAYSGRALRPLPASALEIHSVKPPPPLTDAALPPPLPHF
jgi:hypothetical protein